MSYFDTYKTRLNISSNGLDITNSMVEKTFKDSPSYRLATIDNVDVDIRVINTDKDNIKKIAFMPDYKVNVGKIVNFDNENWLITEFEDNKVPPVAKIILCNKTMNYSGLSKLIPCVYSNATFYSLGIDENKWVTIPDGKVSIMVELNENTKDIYNGMRFVFDKRNIYKTTFVNPEKADFDNLTGYLIITMQQDDELPQDDLLNNIAYNEDLEPQLPIPTGQLIIQGTDSIMINKQSNYNVTYDDGTPLNLTFDWLMELDYTLANITVSDYTSCTLQTSGNSGILRLIARCRENNSIRVTKDITVKKTLW